MIFDPFSQAESSTTRKFGGTGLGLTITRRLVDLLGGTIQFVSEPESGAVFSMVIPTGLDAAAEGSTTEQTQPEQQRTEQTDKDTSEYLGRILVAEDEPSNRLLMDLLLRPIGLDVVVARDGQETIEKAMAESFDVILMDMQMPNVDGYQATRQLRQMGLTVPIVALTASTGEQVKYDCIEAGCNDYLAKPIGRKRLYEMIGKYLANVGSKILSPC